MEVVMQGYVYARQVKVKAAKRRLRRKVNRWHARVIIRHRRRKGARSHGGRA